MFSIALAMLAFPIGAQELLVNGDFSKGETGWFNQQKGTPGVVTELQSDGGRSGACIHLQSSNDGQNAMVIWRQVIEKHPPGRALHVSVWVKGRDVKFAAVCAQGWDKEMKGMVCFATTGATKPMSGTFDWTKIETTLNPTDDTGQVHILLFLAGKGEVWFDDASVTVEGTSVPTLLPGAGMFASSPGVFEARGAFRLVAQADTKETKLLLPLPLDYREQVPLSYQLVATPREGVKSSRIYEEHPGNYVVEVTLAPMSAKDTVEIQWKSLVLAGERSFADVPAAAPILKEWPVEVRPWLQSTLCVEASDPRVQKVAKEIRGSGTDVLKIISATIKKTEAIFGQQKGPCTVLDASQALDKQGSCTSNANLVAALLRANGIPARVLAGYPLWSGPLQTHYIVEAYVPNYGWYPIESTILRERWQLNQQLQVSIVPPENENKSGGRNPAAPGVPYLSLSEFGTPSEPVVYVGIVDEKSPGCDHVARQAAALKGDPTKWKLAVELARSRWQAWLHANSGLTLSSGSLPSATSLDEVIAGLRKH